jgi:hypothetical protein
VSLLEGFVQLVSTIGVSGNRLIVKVLILFRMIEDDRFLVPAIDGALLSTEWKEAL